MTVLTGRTVVL